MISRYQFAMLTLDIVPRFKKSHLDNFDSNFMPLHLLIKIDSIVRYNQPNTWTKAFEPCYNILNECYDETCNQVETFSNLERISRRTKINPIGDYYIKYLDKQNTMYPMLLTISIMYALYPSFFSFFYSNAKLGTKKIVTFGFDIIFQQKFISISFSIHWYETKCNDYYQSV